MKEYLPYIIPSALTAAFNFLMYLWIKKRVDNSIERYKISYSGVFREKIDVYKCLLQKIHDLRLKINLFQTTDDEQIKHNLRGDFNELIKVYIVNRPFISDHLTDLFKKLTVELQSIYEAFVLGSVKSNRHLDEELHKEREKEYWNAINRLRKGEILNEIESEIIKEIRKDLQIITSK